jgi:transcriptional regulator with GAF, ATPase, and Fis domain
VDKGLKKRVEELERGLIRAALRKAHGVQARAAKELKISERVLRYKMQKHGLKIEPKLLHSYRIIDLEKSTKKHNLR